jgi:hypothetical protein
MTSSLTYAQRSYGGSAAPTTITQTISSSGATTLNLADTTSWLEANTGSKLTTSGNIVVAVDYGLPTEEKIRCNALSTNGPGATLTILERAYDGTTTQSHNSGATVAVVASAIELAEANKSAVSTSFLNTTVTNGPAPGLITIGPVGAQGTSIYAASADHVHALPIATLTGQINATYVQGLMQTPTARLYTSSGTQSVASSTDTKVTLATSDYAKNSMAVGASGITVPIAGVYRITGYIHWSTAMTANWYFNPQINGTVPSKGLNAQYINYPGNTATAGNVVFEYSLAANDVITLNTRQTMAGAATIDYASLSVTLIGY